MNTRLLVFSLLLSVSALAQSFTNANVTNVDARGGVAQAIGRGTGWYAWSVPVADDLSVWGDGCALGGDRGFSINRHDDDRLGGGSMVVAVKLEAGQATKVQLFPNTCSINGRGNSVRWLQNVDAGSSIAFLETLDDKHAMGAIAQHDHPSVVPALERKAARSNSPNTREQALFWLGQRGGERGFVYLRDFLRNTAESHSLRKKAVFSLSQSEVDGAVPELINLARHDADRSIRREAIFWLGQRAGEKAAAELRRSVDEDPDEDVREHAVFAISQLPRERSVPMLADLARNHKSPGVRKKALFWLAQTGDDRAIDLIEEILIK